ncbi:hypothetical protein NXY56_001178 [Leishmania guyanensis]|uniref:Uncharacterized protein n=1 Tax=Leishmania guyanensis TaxID=5670 RepID=A0A1E1IQI8_LEIGU|nr:hypothetical protein, conserved [Leishmania guyanensis]
MANAPPLCRRLQLLQPTLPLFATSHNRSPKIASGHPSVAPLHMSYSFAVVPPPAPSATPAFEAHVSTLLRHVPHPTFLTCTSYSPYFTSAESEGAATATGSADHAANAAETSSTQQALSYLHQCLAADVGLALTVTATRATFPAASVQHKSSSPASMLPTTTLTGASRVGMIAVLGDFSRRTSTPPATELGMANSREATRHRSLGLMVLRGDDGGYTRQRLTAAAQKAGASTSPSSPSFNPYFDFADGIDLLGFINSALRSHGVGAMPEASGSESASGAICMCVGGYPQGHVLDRKWGTAQESADAVTAAPAPSEQSLLPYQTPASLRFLDEVDAVLTSTEARLRRAQGTYSSPHPPSVESCVEIAGALLARLDAVRRLWTMPSSYPPDVRAACTRRTIADKVLLRPPGTRQCVAAGTWGASGNVGACVVVTQMITSAAELLDYVEDIRSALCSSVATARSVLCDHDGNSTAATEEKTTSLTCVESTAPAAMLPSSSPSLVVVPGLMAPLRGDQFLRSTLQLKVIPSPPFQAALHEYEGALHSAVETLRKAAASTKDTAHGHSSAPTGVPERKPNCSVSRGAIDMYQQAKETAETCFQERMVDITVAIVRDLRAHGYTHVNFSTFQYGCGDAVGRVVAALAAEGGEAVAPP